MEWNGGVAPHHTPILCTSASWVGVGLGCGCVACLSISHMDISIHVYIHEMEGGGRLPHFMYRAGGRHPHFMYFAPLGWGLVELGLGCRSIYITYEYIYTYIYGVEGGGSPSHFMYLGAYIHIG